MATDLVLRSTIQGIILSGISNILAQLISCYQAGTSWSIDPVAVSRFAAFAIISTPPNIAWQSLLESYFPARLPSKKGPPQLSVRNTAIKFVLDQTFGALFNTVLFLAGMDLLRGETDMSVILGHVQAQSWPLIRAGYRIWPLASLFSFTLVPLHLRTVFNGLVGVVWGIYLSLIEGQKKSA